MVPFRRCCYLYLFCFVYLKTRTRLVNMYAQQGAHGAGRKGKKAYTMLLGMIPREAHGELKVPKPVSRGEGAWAGRRMGGGESCCLSHLMACMLGFVLELMWPSLSVWNQPRSTASCRDPLSQYSSSSQVSYSCSSSSASSAPSRQYDCNAHSR